MRFLKPIIPAWIGVSVIQVLAGIPVFAQPPPEFDPFKSFSNKPLQAPPKPGSGSLDDKVSFPCAVFPWSPGCDEFIFSDPRNNKPIKVKLSTDPNVTGVPHTKYYQGTDAKGDDVVIAFIGDEQPASPAYSRHFYVKNSASKTQKYSHVTKFIKGKGLPYETSENVLTGANRFHTKTTLKSTSYFVMKPVIVEKRYLKIKSYNLADGYDEEIVKEINSYFDISSGKVHQYVKTIYQGEDTNGVPKKLSLTTVKKESDGAYINNKVIEYFSATNPNTTYKMEIFLYKFGSNVPNKKLTQFKFGNQWGQAMETDCTQDQGKCKDPPDPFPDPSLE